MNFLVNSIFKYNSETDKIKHSCLGIFLLLFSRSVMSDSLGPHGLQHARRPCLSPSPRACSNSRLLSRDAIQTSHPLSSPSPPAFSLSQNQGLF